VRRLPREERIHDIVTAARAAFAANGYHNTSMVEIASKAGVAEGTIYKFFDGKRSLMLAILRDWYEGMIADGEAKLAGVEGTRARLRLLIWHHLSVIQAAPDLCKLFYAEVRSHDDYRGSALFHLNRDVTRRLISILQDGIRAGNLRPDLDVRLVRDLVYGGIEHHVTNFLNGHGDLDVDRLADNLTDFVLHGAGRPISPEVERFERSIARLERVAARLERT
jgi:AcrR family transcriptional regulator